MENPSFHLEGIIKSKEEMEDFEGPLNLILMLLSKNKIEIRDIKIAEILEQYLDYLERMQHMDLEIASEFVQMASHLVYIKTKTLLAGTEEVDELQQLIENLEQMQSRERFTALKENIPVMSEALAWGAQLFSTPQEPMPKFGEYSYRHEPWELLAALAVMMTKPAPVPEEEARIVMPKPIIYSARDKGRQIIGLLSQGGTKTLRELYGLAQSRSELVATFISVLEMCAIGSIAITRLDGEYIVSFMGGDTEEILESISE